MANQPTASDRLGVSPAKLKLIGLLALILVAVLYIQYGRSGDEVVPTKPAARASRVAKKASKPLPQATPGTQKASSRGFVDISSWNEPELATVIQYDPFALPATFPQPKPKIAAGLSSEALAALHGPDMDEQAREEKLQQMHQTLAQLRKKGVQVIITKGDEFVALIGKDVYRVGDDIGGFKITSIDTNGVQVEGVIQQ